ncbi:hypothetical protein BZA77DRAFT_118228 [Pyronema omphalodes]|nr:hypothetical protein BZA77DRAFT_118228 [Pyronema omphalodes]
MEMVQVNAVAVVVESRLVGCVGVFTEFDRIWRSGGWGGDRRVMSGGRGGGGGGRSGGGGGSSNDALLGCVGCVGLVWVGWAGWLAGRRLGLACLSVCLSVCLSFVLSAPSVSLPLSLSLPLLLLLSAPPPPLFVHFCEGKQTNLLPSLGGLEHVCRISHDDVPKHKFMQNYVCYVRQLRSLETTFFCGLRSLSRSL